MTRGDDERRVLHDLMENLGEASSVLSGIDDKLKWSETLRKYLVLQEARWARRTRRTHRLIGGLAVGFVLALVALSYVQHQASAAAAAAADATRRNRGLIAEQRRSLLVGCVLLSQAIVDSTASGKPRTTAIRDSRERQEILVRIVTRQATRAELDRIALLSERIRKAGGAIPLPPCERVVRNPERFESVIAGG